MKRLLSVCLLPALVCGVALSTSAASASHAPLPQQVHLRHTTSTATKPKPRHVFVINLENKGFAHTWGAASLAPYLAKHLRSKGVLLTQYYGTVHNSLGNYLAQVSGQGPTTDIQNDCSTYVNMVATRVAKYDQRVGNGCIFSSSTPTLMKQLDAHHLTWRGYMDDMDSNCQHSPVGGPELYRKATPGHEYATRHDPFMYFHSVINRPTYCAKHVVKLHALVHDLKRVSTTRNLTYITPDVCDDGHDAVCADGRTGGLTAFNAWIKIWAPRILQSPAFRKDGVLVITADESDGKGVDSSACCGEGPTPNVAQPGQTGPGGGRIGALVISRWTKAGSTSKRPYNHYSLLGSMERFFGVKLIGYAQTPHLNFFGKDVFNKS